MGNKKNVLKANKATRPKLLLSLAKTYAPSSTSPLLTVALPDGFSSKLTLDLHHGHQLPAELKDWIFSLFEKNMKAMYEASAGGYDRDDKHAELFHPDSRFVVLSPQPGAAGLGFAMYRFDTEHTAKDRRAEVLYCYEVQVAEDGRGRGVGTLLVEILATLGKVWSMEKVMLTVFKSNAGALALYCKAGFLEDEISPGMCGHDDEDYTILSRACV